MEKVAFISGANRGIGFETSKKLAEQGIKVILGSRDMDKGKKALKELAAQGIQADLIQYDAADLEAPQKIYDYISEKYNKLDILVNNAGVLLTGNLFVTNSTTVSDKDIKETFVPHIRNDTLGPYINITCEGQHTPLKWNRCSASTTFDTFIVHSTTSKYMDKTQN